MPLFCLFNSAKFNHRLTPRFIELHTQIWHAMKAEVLKSYAQQQKQQ